MENKDKPTGVTYEILWASSAHDLQEEVTCYLRQGWRLYGQPFHVEPRGVGRWAQAVLYIPQQAQPQLATPILVPGPGSPIRMQ